MNYACGYAVNVRDMFCNFSFKRLKYTVEQCMKRYKSRHKEYLMEEVFKYSCKLILDDVIYNNATFHLPTLAKKCKIHMKRYDGEEFKKARQNGKWKDVDILESNFSGNQMVLEYQQGGVRREKRIYLDSKYRDLITEYTNAGKQYF